MAKKPMFPGTRTQPDSAAMVQPPPVPPISAQIEVQAEAQTDSQSPESAKRRTTHGIVCKCGSVDVEIERTQNLSLQYPVFARRDEKTVRRYCRCQKCGARWSRVSRISEEVIK